MTHHTRAAIIAAVSSIIAIIVVILAPQALADLAGSQLPAPLAHARLYLVPVLTYAAAWAGHYLVTRDPTPPLPPEVRQEAPPKPPA
jgi:hypothetical protein